MTVNRSDWIASVTVALLMAFAIIFQVASWVTTKEFPPAIFVTFLAGWFAYRTSTLLRVFLSVMEYHDAAVKLEEVTRINMVNAEEALVKIDELVKESSRLSDNK